MDKGGISRKNRNGSNDGAIGNIESESKTVWPVCYWRKQMGLKAVEINVHLANKRSRKKKNGLILVREEFAERRVRRK